MRLRFMAAERRYVSLIYSSRLQGHAHGGVYQSGHISLLAHIFCTVVNRRLVARRGVGCSLGEAIVAIAHNILTFAYTLLRKREPYQERGAAAMDERQKDRVLLRTQRRFEQLGYIVHLEPLMATTA